jgi:hypothetical protein
MYLLINKVKMPFILTEILINSSHEQPGFFWAKLISEKLSRSKTSISKQKNKYHCNVYKYIYYFFLCVFCKLMENIKYAKSLRYELSSKKFEYLP